MAEGDPLGVESLAGKLRESLLQDGVLYAVEARASVHRIADDRQALGREVHADLVGAARHEPAAQRA